MLYSGQTLHKYLWLHSNYISKSWMNPLTTILGWCQTRLSGGLRFFHSHQAVMIMTAHSPWSQWKWGREPWFLPLPGENEGLPPHSLLQGCQRKLNGESRFSSLPGCNKATFPNRGVNGDHVGSSNKVLLPLQRGYCQWKPSGEPEPPLLPRNDKKHSHL